MAIKRMCSLTRLKPECVAAYREYHADVWPELLEAYREAGIRKISCFLKGCDLVVYSEVDESRFEKRKDWLAAQDVEKRWSALMIELQDISQPSRKLEEVFRMDDAAEL